MLASSAVSETLEWWLAGILPARPRGRAIAWVWISAQCRSGHVGVLVCVMDGDLISISRRVGKLFPRSAEQEFVVFLRADTAP